MHLRSALTLCALLMLAPSPAPAADPPIDVLMIGQFTCARGDAGWPRLQAACAAEGVRLTIRGEGVVESVAYSTFTADLLRQFQVVIFCGLPSELQAHSPGKPESAEAMAAFRDRLDAYARAGGGIIWSPFSIGHGATYWTELVGRRYDVAALEEDLLDPGKAVVANPVMPFLTTHLWTEAVDASHPVSAGVRGLLLPRQGEWGWPGTVPMRYGKSWQVLVRGMESTRTIGNAEPVGSGHHAFQADRPGSWASAPDIVGVREGTDGSGRMMVLPLYSGHTWLNLGNAALGDAVMRHGAGGHPSDGLRLFLNACRWLAAPAAKAGLGGHRPEPQPERTVVPTLDWSTVGTAPGAWCGSGSWWNGRTQQDVAMDGLLTPGGRDFRGVVGARTARGGGAGTVAEYVAEAKRLGLSFLVFLDELEKIDDAAYAALSAECRAASDATFLAIPGYLCRDTIDAQYFFYDVKALPQPGNLTPDRRVKTPNIEIITSNGYRAVGLAGLGRMAFDPWYLISYFAISPEVYEDGVRVDDGFEVYRSLQGRMRPHRPVGLSIVRSPANLARSVADAPVTVVHASDLAQARRHLIGTGDFMGERNVYLTTGPRIQRWAAFNPIGHPFAPGKQRVRFVLEAEAEAGLAEVRLIDARSGANVRRFVVAGDKAFTCIVDETHLEQWNLIPVVTDVRGRRAIGATRLTFQDGNRMRGFTDGVDADIHTIDWDQEGRKLVQFPGWLGKVWSKGVLSPGEMPSHPRPGELAFAGFDGGQVHGSSCDITPYVVTERGREPANRAYRLGSWSASFDYAVAEYVSDRHYLLDQRRAKPGFRTEGPGSGWWAITEPPVPTTIADVVVSTAAVRGRHLAEQSVKLVEVEVRFKQDGILKEIELGRSWRSYDWGPHYAAARDQDGEVSWVDDGKANRMRRSGTLGAGGYFMTGTDYGGSPAVVNLGATPITYRYDGQRTVFAIAGGDRPVKAGETATARFLVLQRAWEGQNTSLWLRSYIADLAAGGGTPGYRYEATQGKVRAVNYLLELEPEDGGAALSVGKHPLPHNLPVAVSGLAANAVAGRYNPETRQLLILPVLRGSATTSINTTRGDVCLYLGELFRCANPHLRLSCVQDAPDSLRLEVHNPTDTPQTARLAAARGFAPLAGLDREVAVPAGASVQLALPVVAGTLAEAVYRGD